MAVRGIVIPRYAVTSRCPQQFWSAMDAYPQPYVADNLPFVLLCGLEADGAHVESHTNDSPSPYPLLKGNGILIESDFPPLEGGVAEELRDVFLAEDASRSPQDDLSGERPGVEYKIKSVGRVRCILIRIRLHYSH